MYENEDIILGKLRTNREQLENMASYLTAPVATYTHSANKEVVISAVDVSTNRFTSVGHGLVNGNTVYPVMNYTAGNIFPVDIYAGGVGSKAWPGYYVKKISDDVFELYSDSGLTTIIDITTNANLDLTKWHFETSIIDFQISNLTAAKKYKLIIKGRTLVKDDGAAICINEIGLLAEYLVNGTGGYVVSATSATADISVDIEVLITCDKYLTMKAIGSTVKSVSSTTNALALVQRTIKSPKYYDTNIVSLEFYSWFPANGLTVEVYKA